MDGTSSMPDMYEVMARETISIFSRLVKEKKQVSPQVLAEMYAENAQITGLISGIVKNQAALDKCEELEQLKEGLRIKKDELYELEFAARKKTDIFLKVVRTLSILSRSEKNQAINSLIEKLNEYVRAADGFKEELIEQTLSDLRQEVLSTENSEKQDPGKKKSFFGELFKAGRTVQGEGAAAERNIRELLTGIVLRFQLHEPGFDHKVTSLAEKIKKDDMSDLKPIHDEICELIGSYREKLNEEKSTLFELVQEIATKLVATEKELLQVFSESQASVTRSSVEFNDSFVEEIKGIEDGLLQGNSIEDIKKLVFEKLGNIKASFQKKREHEQKTLEETRIQIEHFTTAVKGQEQEMRKVRERTDLDPLTGIFNRNAFQQKLKELFGEYGETGSPASLIVFDTDSLRKINEEYTFDNGDRILRTIAQVVTGRKEKDCFFARYGGGEFALLLPSRQAEAESYAEELRKTIMQIEFYHMERKVPVSISVGVAGFQGEKSPLHILQKAHGALGEAKKRKKTQASASR